MTTKTDLVAEWGDLYSALSNAFATGNRDAFVETLDRLGEARKQSLYQEMRELTGSLRFALDRFPIQFPARDVGRQGCTRRTGAAGARAEDDGGWGSPHVGPGERSCPLAEHTAKQATALVASLNGVRREVARKPPTSAKCLRRLPISWPSPNATALHRASQPD